MAAEICATGLADMMRYDDKQKQWIQHLDDGQPSTVQVVHDRTTQTFVLVVSRLHAQGHVIVMKQQIYRNLKYQTNNNNHFHQWRDEQRTVYGLSFSNEQHAMDVHRAVRDAQKFLNDLINSEHVNGVYQEPQGHYYASAHPPTTNVKQHQQYQQQPEAVYRDTDNDSIGSNGYNRKYSYAVHPQITGGQPVSQQQQQQQAALQQQQRRASQGSSGSSSTVSGNIYATAHLNGYNNGNAVSATANGSAQMSIGQMQQQPVRVQNGPPSQHHLNGTHMNGHMNGHHPPQQQVPLRTPVPPAPAPISQPASVSTAPPPPPPPPVLNGSGPVAKVGNAPPAPPPPPPNICKINSGDKPLTMAEQLQQKQLRKTEQNGSADTNGAVNGAQRPKPKGGASMDLMSELNKKLLQRQNQEEIVSVASTTSTGSTSSTEITVVEKKDQPPAQKTWAKPANNIAQNGHMNGGMDSPKVPKKQFSISNATLQSAEDPNTIMCTKADLDKLRAELLNEISTMKQQIMEAITKGQ